MLERSSLRLVRAAWAVTIAKDHIIFPKNDLNTENQLSDLGAKYQRNNTYQNGVNKFRCVQIGDWQFDYLHKRKWLFVVLSVFYNVEVIEWEFEEVDICSVRCYIQSSEGELLMYLHWQKYQSKWYNHRRAASTGLETEVVRAEAATPRKQLMCQGLRIQFPWGLHRLRDLDC